MTRNPHILGALTSLFLAPAASAVILNFDTDLEGFVIQANGLNVSHSTYNGGSMALTVNGGWAGNSLQLALQNIPDLWAEAQTAAIFGGGVSFDLLIDTTASSGSLVDPASGPNWLQPVVTGNSGGAGGWDQNVMSGSNLAAGGVAWPTANGGEAINVFIPIIPTAGGATGNDGQIFYDTVPGWSNIHFGINSEGAVFDSSYTVYIDNFELTSIPEPSAALFSVMAGLGLLRRRR